MVNDQLKLSDELQKSARGANYWYGGIWKTVEKCVFCDLNERYTIHETDGVVLTTNIYPYITGHLLIVPKRHITHLKQLKDKEWEAVRVLTYLSKKMLKKLFGVKAIWNLYREGSLGKKSQKTVDHLHIHIIPYKEGLVQWNYQDIKCSPFEVASLFRDNEELTKKYVERYKRKYQNN